MPDAGEEFVCAVCGGKFVTDWSQEEAEQELEDQFGVQPHQVPTDIVCDDCYQIMMGA